MIKKFQINHIIATEFEITKGNDIVACYPQTFDFSLENILIEKLIPDGIHNFQKDIYEYKHLVPINQENLKTILKEFNS